MKYLSVVPIYYSGFSVQTINLSNATFVNRTTQYDVTSHLQNIDGDYVIMDSSAFINLTFNINNSTPLPPGYVRDFIFECVGYYNVTNHSNKPFIVKNQIPLTNKLYYNYPNPFNPTTTIRYEINKDELVKIKIYNILGQEVITLVNDYKKAGSYNVSFDGSNLASGVYFYRIEAGSFAQTKKMVLVK